MNFPKLAEQILKPRKFRTLAGYRLVENYKIIFLIFFSRLGETREEKEARMLALQKEGAERDIANRIVELKAQYELFLKDDSVVKAIEKQGIEWGTACVGQLLQLLCRRASGCDALHWGSLRCLRPPPPHPRRPAAVAAAAPARD